MLSEKEIKVYETIKKFIEFNNYSPSIRELCNILSFKSTKTVYRYLMKLMEKQYISFQKNKKRSIIVTNHIRRKIMVLNTKEIISFNIDLEHIVFQIKNNYFNEYFIKKNDFLIINIKKKIRNNDLGLFIIDNEYRIMKYNYYDGYYILEDNKKEILYKINLLGVVEKIIREKI